MLNRRRVPLALAAGCLILATGAAAAEPNEFSATSTPTHVKPSLSVAYEVELVNSAASEHEANRAKVGIPPDFVVDPDSVQASTSAAGDCVASSWVADGALIAEDKINLQSDGNPHDVGLCEGATLTVAFSARSAETEGSYTWTTELLRDETAFAVTGGLPTVQVDGTPPQTTIDSSPPEETNSTTASFTFGSSEAGSSFQCSLDGDAFAACGSPTEYAGLDAGAHTFAVQATDPAGNTDPTPASDGWTVDLTAPETTIGSGPPPFSNQTSASFTFSSEPGATFECSLDTVDEGEFAACTSPKAYTDVPEGLRTFRVRATDTVGNVAPTPATRSWTTDTTPPTVAIEGDKPGNPTNSQSVTFTFTSSEPSTVECELDGVTSTPCASPKAYPGPIADGQHTFVVRATDAAGNAADASHTWEVDSAAPTVSIGSGPASATKSRSATFTFAAEAGATTQCKLDSDAFEQCNSSQTYSGLPDGSHTFTVKATDAAANTGEDVYTWTIDNVAPAVTIVQAPNNPSDVKSPTFAFLVNEGTAVCKLDGGAFSPCASPKAYSNLLDGDHAFTVSASDAAGNTAQAMHSWRIETKLPVATLTDMPRNPSTSTSASFHFASRAGATFECSLHGGAFAACTSPKQYAGLAQGGHTFAVRAKDAAGTGPVTSYAWSVDSVGPTAVITQTPAARTTAASATFTFTASEAAAFQCKLDAGAFAPCTSPKTHTGLGRTAHSFEVRAVDAAGNVDPTPAIHRWTVTAPVATRTRKAASALLAPRAGARVSSAPLLRWRRVPRASYYNVQVYRGSVKVLSSWPTGTRFQMKARWRYLGRQRRLTAGTYRWYVWPGFGKASARRYGRSLGGSTFRVVSSARR